jgi:hypothetical protein
MVQKSSQVFSGKTKNASLHFSSNVLILGLTLELLRLQLGHCTLLALLLLLTPSVGGQTPWLVHIEPHDHKQHHHAANRVGQGAFQPPQIATGRGRVCGYARKVVDCPRLHQQDGRGHHGQQE